MLTLTTAGRRSTARLAVKAAIQFEYLRIQENEMKTFESTVPALVAFGPIIMVMGLSNTPSTFGMVIAYAGALMVSGGCAYLFRQLIHLRGQQTPGDKHI